MYRGGVKALAMLAVLGACGSSADTPDAPLPPDAAPGCGCRYGSPHLAGAVTPEGADELSGLAVSAIPDTVWTHNDKGDVPRLFALTTHGAGKGIALLPGATAVDWEDIAVAPCGATSCIYVADTGDNLGTRLSVRIYEVDEPQDFRGMVELSYRGFDITYPDGPHDAEALFVDPRDGASYVITKQEGPVSTVFLMPRVTGAAGVATAMSTLTLAVGDRRVTAADLRADACGVRLLVRTYSSLWELSGPVGASVPQLLGTMPVSVPVAIEPQGESVAYLPSGHAYLTVTDGPAASLSRVTCE